MLSGLQRGLEKLYRIDTQVSVEDYLIDEETRDQFDVDRTPGEQLLLSQDGDDLAIGLFVNRATIDNLHRNDPRYVLGDHNMQDFLHAIEGVSHFVYVAWRAAFDRPVSALELELQAEVDKFVTCVLTTDSDNTLATTLHRRLFEQFTYEPDLDASEERRYRVANSNAARYSASLRRRFVATNRIADMLRELRRFYRMSLHSKLAFIDRLS